MRIRAGLVAAAALAGVAFARTAAAQWPEGPYVAAEGRVAIAGELAATASPPDNQTFFNYTDYEHDALRTVRARLLGQWRLAAQLALLGELRLENTDSLEAAALYVRWRPFARHELDIQAGRIPPVVGAFVRRAYGRDNLVIGVPLAYQYLTSIRPDALPASADDLLAMRGRGWRSSFPIGSAVPGPGTPLVTAFRWGTGVEAHWRNPWLDVAGAVTNGTPGVPRVFKPESGASWSSRVAVTPLPALTVGVSASRGRWIQDAALSAVPAAMRTRDAQTLLMLDAEVGAGRWLARGEWIRSAFQMPAISAPLVQSPLVASSGFVEGRYRWHPRWQAAMRVERLDFSHVRGTVAPGSALPWDAPVRRIETVIGFRATRNLELRGGWQYDWRRARRVTTRGVPAMQILYWF